MSGSVGGTPATLGVCARACSTIGRLLTIGRPCFKRRVQRPKKAKKYRSLSRPANLQKRTPHALPFLLMFLFACRLCRTDINPVEYNSPIDREPAAQTDKESAQRRGTLRVAETESERVTIQTGSQTAQCSTSFGTPIRRPPLRLKTTSGSRLPCKTACASQLLRCESSSFTIYGINGVNEFPARAILGGLLTWPWGAARVAASSWA